MKLTEQGGQGASEGQLTVGTLNVGSLTRRCWDVADIMEKKQIDILCVQETRWKGKQETEIGENFKMLNSGADEKGRSGVAVFLNKVIKENILEVERKNCRIIKIKLCFSGHIVNVISAYAPQVGCSKDLKKRFWEELEEIVSSIKLDERLIIGGDLNGHIGCNPENISKIHGGHGMGKMNKEGELIVKFALAFDVAMINTFFKNKNYTTYSSGGRETQIDFLMCRRSHLREVKNCKIIKGESVNTQHRLVISDFLID
ncbi:craniofacial development protein 2-like [Palaemon carinicauda]|uniref:craniofacial development protein 2-like n=1 Tax=Palaemon carinicauda TaxID=392227 RepID=UPI0035B6650C